MLILSALTYSPQSSFAQEEDLPRLLVIGSPDMGAKEVYVIWPDGTEEGE